MDNNTALASRIRDIPLHDIGHRPTDSKRTDEIDRDHARKIRLTEPAVPPTYDPVAMHDTGTIDGQRNTTELIGHCLNGLVHGRLGGHIGGKIKHIFPQGAGNAFTACGIKVENSHLSTDLPDKPL